MVGMAVAVVLVVVLCLPFVCKRNQESTKTANNVVFPVAVWPYSTPP